MSNIIIDMISGLPNKDIYEVCNHIQKEVSIIWSYLGEDEFAKTLDVMNEAAKRIVFIDYAIDGYDNTIYCVKTIQVYHQADSIVVLDSFSNYRKAYEIAAEMYDYVIFRGQIYELWHDQNYDG